MARPIVTLLHTGFTAISATTKTRLGGASVTVPAWAKSVLAVEPTLTPDALTLGEPVLGLCSVESGDVAILPFEVLPAPTGSGPSSSLSSFQGKPEKYVIDAPISGGENIDVYITGGYDHTAEPYGGATLVVSNGRTGRKQKHAKLGTVTSTGTTASSDVAGTRYNFSGAEHIIEMIGIAVPGVLAAGDGMVGYIKYTSSEFDGVADVKLPLVPIGAVLGTGATQALVAGVSRQEVDIPLNPGRGQVNIQDYAYFGLIPAAAGRFVDGVIFE